MSLRTSFQACALFLAMISNASAQASYTVSILQGLGGDAGGNGMNNRGWSTGTANTADNSSSRAVVWFKGSQPINLGTLGNGENSAVAWPVKSNNGVVVGISDTSDTDPLNQSFSCWPFYGPSTPTKKICKGFRWQSGKMTALPPFAGGYSSYAAAVNNRGQVVGWAENGIHDPSCNPNFQVLQFHATLWEPNGEMLDLPPLPGDSVSAATAINDKGQVVGISGSCDFAVGWGSARHAVLWENGIPHDIGNLGGMSWNTPGAINNNGVVVGFSLPPGQEGTSHYRAFVWTKETGLKELSEMPGVIRSAAAGVNIYGQIVGFARTADGVAAVVWENANAPIKNLNELVPAGSPYLTVAGDINDSGQITGYACSHLCEPGDSLPAFVASPLTEKKSTTSTKEIHMVQVPDAGLDKALGRWGAIAGND